MSKAPEAAGAGHAARSYPPRPAAVYFYGTCLVDMFVPEAGMDAITLLEREGIRVIFPDNQTCCGQPAYTSGFPDEARQVVESQLNLFPGENRATSSAAVAITRPGLTMNGHGMQADFDRQQISLLSQVRTRYVPQR